MNAAESVSLACVVEKHEECTKEDCSCWCHDEGGVREPRTPGGPPSLSAMAES